MPELFLDDELTAVLHPHKFVVDPTVTHVVVAVGVLAVISWTLAGRIGHLKID